MPTPVRSGSDEVTLGLDIARRRRAKGLKQEDLARLLGTTKRTVGRWERGLSVPHEKWRRPLVEALGIKSTESLVRLGLDVPPQLALLQNDLPTERQGDPPVSRDELSRTLLKGLNEGFVTGEAYVEVARQLAREVGMPWK